MDPCQGRVFHQSYPLLCALEGFKNQINQTVHMVAMAVYPKANWDLSACTFHSGPILRFKVFLTLALQLVEWEQLHFAYINTGQCALVSIRGNHLFKSKIWLEMVVWMCTCESCLYYTLASFCAGRKA